MNAPLSSNILHAEAKPSQRLREIGFSEAEIILQLAENAAAAAAQASSLYGDVATGLGDGSTPPDETPPADGSMPTDQPGAPADQVAGGTAADSNSPIDTQPADAAALQPLNRAPERVAPSQ